MSRHEMSYHLLPSMSKQLPLMLSLIAFIVIFASCKPAAAPSTISPLSTPSTSLPPDVAKKLTPAFPIQTTPVPPFFRPELLISTPAGSGNIGRMLPLFFVHQIDVTNVWFKDTADETMRTYVFAGSKPEPGGGITPQGLVFIQIAKMSSQGHASVIYEKEFLTPTQSGPVSVKSAVNDRLILQSTNGTTFYFDVPSRQFVSSMTVIVPTATVSISPLATPTPAP